MLVVAAVLLALRLLLALTLIPPWQQPDEATHVALVQLQRSRVERRAGTPDPAREYEILQSMSKHRWWDHRGPGWHAPVPVPSRFGQQGAANRVVVEVVGISDPPAYFLAMGRVLSWLPRLSITGDLYFLRGVSALFGLLTLGAVWLAAREFAGPASAAVVTLILALHPHFAVVSTAASPDSITNFLAACLWWQAAILLRTPSIARLLLLWALTVAAVAADRMAIPLVLVAIVVSAGALRSLPSLPTRRAVAGLAGTAILAIGALAAVMWVFDAFGSTYGWRRVFSALVPVEGAMTWSRFVGFSWQLHRSWWFTLGWGRYTAPHWWTAIATAITVVAALGVTRRLVRWDGTTAPSSRLIVLALAGIGIQLFAVYWTYFRLGNGAQGRYFLPVLAPSLVLLWAGIEAWVPPSGRRHAAAVLTMTLALLDGAGWILVAVPAYYASF